MSNRLKYETSPYLLQHKDNPVDWYPWCSEAFTKAKTEDKPIFLSIGYSTCHWCHVMAHESFEDKRTAEILNKYFVSIKVDREERPDIDSVYMKACQAFTGSGGWPMSIFMTWDKKPFFAGSYFPLRPRYGMPGFGDILLVIASQWKNNKKVFLDSADEVISHLRQVEAEKTGAVNNSGEEALYENIILDCEELTKQAVNIFKESFDNDYGGFGGAPKFPMPHNLMFLLLYGRQYGDIIAVKMAELTLTQMRKGGIFDHIGHGFSRYSTDRYYLIPHFEKMLYDNALMIMAYSAAYMVTKEGLFLDTAKQTAEYVLREMTSRDGGFYCAQDADSEGIEGRFYTFTYNEILEVLGREQGLRFARTFDITPEGNFEGYSIPNLLKNNDFKTDFSHEIKTLYAYRNKRARIHPDDKILVSWNSLMIAALCMLHRTSKNYKYLEAAKKACEFIEANLSLKGQLFTLSSGGKHSKHGFLDDYAFYTAALIEVYNSTLDNNYLEKAELFCDEAFRRFSDNGDGYYLCEDGSGELFLNPKETSDGAVPRGNSVMAYNLVRLYQLTENTKYKKLLEKQFTFMCPLAKTYPAGYCMFLISVILYENPPEHITVVLKSGSDSGQELTDVKARLPFLANVVVESENGKHPLLNDKTTYYVCRNHQCLPGTNEYRTVT
ncbi:MAG: thioredoxin domain-containing protein [Lachnospiraceae bacterium]